MIEIKRKSTIISNQQSFGSAENIKIIEDS